MEMRGPSAPGTPAPALRRPRRPTARQVEAVYSVMRLLRNDTPRAGAGDEILCAACRRSRDRSGSASYDGYTLCNGCATDFELLRLSGSVDRIEEFLATASAGSARRSGRRPAG